MIPPHNLRDNRNEKISCRPGRRHGTDSAARPSSRRRPHNPPLSHLLAQRRQQRRRHPAKTPRSRSLLGPRLRRHHQRQRRVERPTGHPSDHAHLGPERDHEYITELDAPLTETGLFYTEVKAGDIVYFNPRDSIPIIYAPRCRFRPSPKRAMSPRTSPPSRTCPTPWTCASNASKSNACSSRAGRRACAARRTVPPLHDSNSRGQPFMIPDVSGTSGLSTADEPIGLAHALHGPTAMPWPR